MIGQLLLSGCDWAFSAVTHEYTQATTRPACERGCVCFKRYKLNAYADLKINIKGFLYPFYFFLNFYLKLEEVRHLYNP